MTSISSPEVILSIVIFDLSKINPLGNIFSIMTPVASSKPLLVIVKVILITSPNLGLLSFKLIDSDKSQVLLTLMINESLLFSKLKSKLCDKIFDNIE